MDQRRKGGVPITTDRGVSPTGKIKLFHRGSHIEIVWKWRGWGLLFETAFVVIWDGSLFMWFRFEALSLVAILFLAVGIGVTYVVLAEWLNRTQILVSDDKIKVRHSPLPWLGNKELPVLDLSELRTRENVFDSAEGVCTNREYRIIAKTRLGREVTLAKFADILEAQYVQQEIEKYLGLEYTAP